MYNKAFKPLLEVQECRCLPLIQYRTCTHGQWRNPLSVPPMMKQFDDHSPSHDLNLHTVNFSLASQRPTILKNKDITTQTLTTKMTLTRKKLPSKETIPKNWRLLWLQCDCFDWARLSYFLGRLKDLEGIAFGVLRNSQEFSKNFFKNCICL